VPVARTAAKNWPSGVRGAPRRDRQSHITEAGRTRAAMTVANEISIDELHQRHAADCVAYARRIVGDQAVAEEIVQEVFVNLWRLPERYNPNRGTIRSLLRACVRHRAVDRLRSETSRRRREERFHDRSDRGDAEPETLVMDEMRNERVRSGLATLTPDQLAAVELAYFGGYSYREVARALAVPEGTVKSRIRAALAVLRDDLVDTAVA
jgi:RNA polymerase sigma-70 factor (ECF subfamily)